jgi:hypothetical protein
MSKYVVIYTGLPAADANLEVINTSWKHWFQELGAAVVDVGNPFGPCKTVAADGSVSDGGSLKLTGYSILEVESLDSAVEMVKKCPGLTNANIEVYEAIPFS